MNGDLKSGVRNISGRCRDPVFVCMLGAMVLAVGSSLALRVAVSGAGPAAARGANVVDIDDEPAPLPRVPTEPRLTEVYP